MLAVKTYPRTYLEACRARIDSELAAYDRLVAAAKESAGSEGAGLAASIADFEASYFNNLAIVLEAMFVHRLRMVEGKDGNPMNEVRMLVNSLLENDGVFTVEKSIKYTPAKSVLKYTPGDTVVLDEAQFRAMSGAFFASIEEKFLDPE